MNKEVSGPGITDKTEIARYLEENDPEMLDLLKKMQKEFGSADSFAYVKPRRRTLEPTEHAARLTDEELQDALDTIVSMCNRLTEEAKSRYGKQGSLFLCPDGRLLILSKHSTDKYSTIPKIKKFMSKRTCSLAETVPYSE